MSNKFDDMVIVKKKIIIGRSRLYKGTNIKFDIIKKCLDERHSIKSCDSF